MDLKIREVKPSDKNFIYSTMLRGLYYGCDYFNKSNSIDFFTQYQANLDNLLPKCEISIACLDEDEDTIFAYAITLGSKIIFTYTKSEFRKMGIQNKLLAKRKFDSVAFITSIGDSIRINKRLKFTPL